VYKAACAPIHSYCDSSDIEKLWKIGLTHVEGDAVVLINYEEAVGRCLIKVREDHFANFHADFASILLQKAGSRREQALYQTGKDKNDLDKASKILQRMADGLPWIVTICKMNGLEGEPLEALRPKPEEDTEVQAMKGRMKGRGKGKDAAEEGTDDNDNGKSKGGKGKRKKGGGRGKGKDDDPMTGHSTEAASASSASAGK